MRCLSGLKLFSMTGVICFWKMSKLSYAEGSVMILPSSKAVQSISYELYFAVHDTLAWKMEMLA